MKKVIQVVQHLKPGGIETLALELQRFSAPNHQNYIVSLEGSKEEALLSWPRLKPFADRLVFLNKQPGVSMGLYWQLWHLFRKLKADAVHTHHIGPLIYAGVAARMAGVKKLIHTEHDAWHLANDQHCKLQRWAIRWLSPVLVADAVNVAKGVQTYLSIEPDMVISNGIDTETFSPGCRLDARAKLGLPGYRVIIGCSGRLEWEKGHAYLIDALCRLPVDTHLVLAGEGSLKAKLKARARELMVDHRVHFLGRVDDMPSFYRSLDLFCQPSLKEGMPLAPLEAQACGIPAIVTAAGGSRESLCQETGKIVSKRNHKALAGAITELCEYSLLVSQKAQSIKTPRDFVRRHADIRNTAKAYARLYQ